MAEAVVPELIKSLPADVVSTIPAEHLNHSSILRYNSLPELFKGHIEQREVISRSIAMPNGEAKPEEFDKWATEQGGKLKDHGYTISKLGDQRPESPDKYEFKIEGVQDETIKGDKVLGTYRNAAHKLGLNQAQTAGLFDVFAKEIYPTMQQPMPEFVDGDAAKALFEERFKGDAPLRKQEFDLAVTNLSREYPELKDMLKDCPYELGPNKFISIGEYPPFMALLAEIGKLMSPDFGGNLTGAQLQQATDAQTEIDQIRSNKDNPKHALFMKGDKATLAYVDELYKRTTGGK